MPGDFDPMALYDFGTEGLDPTVTYCIEAQEIFEIGTHKGVPYKGGDIKRIADNFARFYHAKPIPLLVPPAVIGHEEDQEILKRSDLPAGGWVTACFVSGTKLVVNIGEIPALVMYWIKTGRIRTVSAEIYEDSGDAGLPAGHGPTLRRVALLGGDIPQVKTLARLKTPVPERAGAAQFSEGRVRYVVSPVNKSIRYFAEGRTMKHPKLFDDMKKEGIDEELATKMSDLPPDMLQKMSACMKRYGDSGVPAPPAPAPTGDAPFDRAAAIELIASTNNIDRALLEAKTDDELKALMPPQQMSDKAEDPTSLAAGTSTAADARTLDTTGGGGNSAKPDAITTTKVGDKGDANVSKMSETTSREIVELRTRLSQLQSRSDEQLRRERIQALKVKQAKVSKFCESAIEEGKITPAEINGGLRDLLMGADDTAVKKFSDGTSDTELDRQIKLINARPKMHIFSEKMPGTPDGGVHSASEQARIKAMKAKTDLGKKALAREAASASKS